MVSKQSSTRIPAKALPLNAEWASEEEYVDSLLSFATGSDLFRNLCGGVHVLDFLTSQPDLYSAVLPAEWRAWFDLFSIDDILDLLLREDLDHVTGDGESGKPDWRGQRQPPRSLLNYVGTIRKHCLGRDFQPVSESCEALPRHITVGMKPKKIHEVKNFAAYVGGLSSDLSEHLQEPISIVDFGSGQNYLGRTLASPPYNSNVIAIERRHHNIDGARGMDVYAGLAKKEKIMRNKKEYKMGLASMNAEGTPPLDITRASTALEAVPDAVIAAHDEMQLLQDPERGSMTYIEHDIVDGHLESILYPPTPEISGTSTPTPSTDSNSADTETDADQSTDHASHPKSIVVSLHSCGNLLHHGLRSLVLNPTVTAVAMIGCCYNLLTERLGPASYKLPQLRPNHPRLEATGSAYDPHGFPMSRTLEQYSHAHGTGVRLNITARMMAVQAPSNWGPVDSEAFFRRHFYRALLQRILFDRGVVQQSSDPNGVVDGNSRSGKDTQGTPLIVGTLSKACFASFRAYVRGAREKLVANADAGDGAFIASRTADLVDGDDIIDAYERDYGYAKKNLAVVWSLMAFSAGVVESIIVVDRWLYLKEQDCVEHCWVEPVFDYSLSPRNLVVVGIKKGSLPSRQ